MNRNDAHTIALARRLREVLDDEGYSDDQQLIEDTLEGETDIMELLDRVIAEGQNADAMANALTAQMDQLRARRTRFDGRVVALKGLAMEILDACGLRKIERAGATVSKRKIPPKVICTDEENLPDEFVRVTRSPDLRAIADAIKSGRDVPGCTLGNGGETVSVRVK